MTQNKFLLIIKYGLIVCLTIPLLREVLGQSGEIHYKPTFSDLTGSHNNQIITDISEEWQLIIPSQNLSSSVNLPLLVSQEVNRISDPGIFSELQVDDMVSRNLWYRRHQF